MCVLGGGGVREQVYGGGRGNDKQIHITIPSINKRGQNTKNKPDAFSTTLCHTHYHLGTAATDG